MYATGQGVPQDHVLAHMWWDISISNGHKNAATNREIITARSVFLFNMKSSKLKKSAGRAKKSAGLKKE